MDRLKGKKVLMVISEGNFRDEEYDVPKKAFEDEMGEVVTASTTTNVVTGKLGMKAKPDILITDVNTSNYDTVVFVGGPGVKQYWEDALAHNIVKKFYGEKKYVCAICSAPVILAKAGMLKGLMATSFAGDQKEMEKNGVKYSKKSVEVDGQFITANGPASASAFAQTIIDKLHL